MADEDNKLGSYKDSVFSMTDAPPDMSRLEISSPDPDIPGSTDGHDGNKANEESFDERNSDTCQYRDEDGIGNPYLKDSYGNLTKWRLSDLEAAFAKHVEDEANNPKPKERKYTKEEKLKIHSDRMEGYMKFALDQYNSKEELVGDMRFEFEKVQRQNWIVEGEFDNEFYYHFNFAAKQACTLGLTFFAEVMPEDGDDCEVICCKVLNDDDNGHCFGCQNEGVDDLRHPACESVYIGGHEDRECPFMENSETEDDSNSD